MSEKQNNPFADWNPEGEPSHGRIQNKTKQQLENIYFKSRRRKSELQQIQVFNSNFGEFVLEAGRQDEAERQKQVFTNFQDKKLLSENEVSFKESKKSQSLVTIGVHLVIIFMILNSEDFFVLVLIGITLQFIVFGVIFLHHSQKLAMIKKLPRSQFFIIEISTLVLSCALALRICFGSQVLTISTCICSLVDLFRVRMLLKLYQAQKMLQQQFPVFSDFSSQQDNFD